MAINIPGFVPAATTRPYLKVCIDGWARTGRTHFGLRGAPEPVGVLALDGNTEHVAKKMIEEYGREIIVNKECMAKFSFVAAQGIPEAEAKLKWERFKHLFFEVLLKSADLKTIVVDTGSDAWALTRAAEHGRMEKVPQFAYGASNHPWRQMVNLCEKNLVITHKLQRFGTNVSRNGMDEVAFLCHAVIRTTRLPKGMKITEDPSDYEATDRGIPIGYWDADPGDGEFAMKIMDCSQDPRLAGKILVASECTFKQVAMLMYPKTTSKDWK